MTQNQFDAALRGFCRRRPFRAFLIEFTSGAQLLIGHPEVRADAELQERMDELAEKCNEGQLTPEEREEYETSIRFANYLAILQSKARRLLKDRKKQ
jgi:hypothetical protein